MIREVVIGVVILAFLWGLVGFPFLLHWQRTSW